VYLEGAAPYELGEPPQYQLGTLYPAYMRGLAYLAQRNDPAAAYQDFLTQWKDADPDVPILKEAKAEYAKLQ
jgi:hypothetical protein